RNVLLIELSANDWLNNRESPTAFATLLGQVCDDLHTAAIAAGVPGFEIWLQTAIYSADASTNAGNFVLNDYRAPMAGVRIGRESFVTKVINGDTDLVVTHSNMVDLYHPNQAGHTEIFHAELGKVFGHTTAAAAGVIRVPSGSAAVTVANPL